MARRPFALALAAGMLLPALVVAYLLWQGFVQQIDESHRKRLSTSLNILELVISKGLEDYRAALSRLAADNTLQVTMGLDIRPQMRRYLRTQFELSEFEYVGVFDLDGNEMVWVGDQPESGTACQSSGFGNDESLAVADGRLFLERMVTVSQQGQALGRLCAGLALNSASLAAVIAPKVDGEAFLYWQDQAFGLNTSVDRPAVEGLGVDGQLLNLVVAGAKYHAMAQSLPIANQLVKGVVLVNQDEYSSASRESLQVVGLVLLSVLIITAFGLRMFELRRKAERQLLREREKAVVTLASIADGVLTTDPDGHITYANPAAEQLLGRRDESVVGSHLYDALELTSEVTGERLLYLEAFANRDTEIRFEDAVLRAVNGRETPVHCAVAPIDRASPHNGSVITFRDVHRERELRRRLAWKASRDDLTGLLNRSEFRRGLKTVIADTRGTDSHHCLLYIDLDEFKAVNDTCGHRAGDDLLRQVSASLLSQLRQADVVARLGGDEFGVILQHCSRERGLEIAGEIIEIINDRRFQYQNRIFHVGASIGMVSVTRDTAEIEDLLATVDAACYAAKERGRNRVFVGAIDSAKILHRMDELSQASSIRQAIKDDRLVLYRQSIVPTSRPSLDNEVHAEVLVRMLDEQGGLVAPGAFIPIAE
ncbi:MAG: diguanylate cyclase, partial [Chromatiaceae bacterium]